MGSPRFLFSPLVCLVALASFDFVALMAPNPHTNDPTMKEKEKSDDAAVNVPKHDGYKPPDINYQKFGTLVNEKKKKLAKQAFLHTGIVFGLASSPCPDADTKRIGIFRSYFEVKDAPVVSAQHCWKALRDIGAEIGKPVKVPKIELFCGVPFVLLSEFTLVAHLAFYRRSAEYVLLDKKVLECKHSPTTASCGACTNEQTILDALKVVHKKEEWLITDGQQNRERNLS